MSMHKNVQTSRKTQSIDPVIIKISNDPYNGEMSGAILGT